MRTEKKAPPGAALLYAGALTAAMTAAAIAGPVQRPEAAGAAPGPRRSRG